MVAGPGQGLLDPDFNQPGAHGVGLGVLGKAGPGGFGGEGLSDPLMTFVSLPRYSPYFSYLVLPYLPRPPCLSGHLLGPSFLSLSSVLLLSLYPSLPFLSPFLSPVPISYLHSSRPSVPRPPPSPVPPSFPAVATPFPTPPPPPARIPSRPHVPPVPASRSGAARPHPALAAWRRGHLLGQPPGLGAGGGGGRRRPLPGAAGVRTDRAAAAR